ncbi:glycosyltransferase [Floricoccus penangensis]|uniref:glycosyltransferase n=1 Tax=Floricoccus penangensis TaxID=1859475 RepID=UPI00203BF97C|nr:glycosyltransferase [Floricoccus penangensis]URZ87773.1 glycosyltransferase [Floricoccus penangensis]
MNDSTKILAGIVTFNPDTERLIENISSIINQVDEVVIIDNGSDNVDAIKNIIREFEKISLIELEENKGIAFALNKIGEFAVENKFDWFLTLDQDSVVLDGLINEYQKYFQLPDIGLLNCYREDRNIKDSEEIPEKVEKKNNMITSGSLMPTYLFKDGFTYDNSLFIDLVDFDLTIRLKKNGYYLYQIPFVGLLHELGDADYHNFLGLKLLTFNYSPFRRYYFSRNAVILIKKYGLSKETWSYLYVGFIVLMKSVFFEKNKFKKIKAYFRGTYDGIRFKAQRYEK